MADVTALARLLTSTPDMVQLKTIPLRFVAATWSAVEIRRETSAGGCIGLEHPHSTIISKLKNVAKYFIWLRRLTSIRSQCVHGRVHG